LVEEFTAEKLLFAWQNQSKTFERDRVWGVVFAGTADASPAAALVHLLDGSVLPGKIAAADDVGVTLQIGGGKPMFPWGEIARVELRSSRIVFLSDLKPLEAEHQPLVTAPRPWQRDRSVLNRPLVLAGKTYAKGLGTHAFARLKFEAGGKYDQLAGKVGLDPALGGKGDCEVKVLADGTEIFSRRLRGAEEPIDLAVDLRGAKEVTLIVAPGEDLDLGDQVNWCDVRFLRQPSKAVKP
jgi:hypothetical protein